MVDKEIQEVRSIRHAISQECGHDLRKLVAYLQTVETELRQSGEFKFAPRSTDRSPPTRKRSGTQKGKPRRRAKGVA